MATYVSSCLWLVKNCTYKVENRLNSKEIKRKSNHVDGQEVFQKHPTARCILYGSGIQHDDFLSPSNAKGSATKKLSQLHNICHRRLMEPQNLPNSIEDVCNQNPGTQQHAPLVNYHPGLPWGCFFQSAFSVKSLNWDRVEKQSDA